MKKLFIILAVFAMAALVSSNSNALSIEDEDKNFHKFYVKCYAALKYYENVNVSSDDYDNAKDARMARETYAEAIQRLSEESIETTYAKLEKFHETSEASVLKTTDTPKGLSDMNLYIQKCFDLEPLAKVLNK